MAPESETFPNYASHAESPKLAKDGVQIVVGPGPHGRDKPIVLRGAILIGGEVLRKSNSQPLSRVLIIVVRRDEPDLWVGAVLDPSSLPFRPIPKEASPPGFRQGGFFNINLAAACPKLVKGGRYWVMASLGDFVSDRIEFSIKAD